MHAVLFLARSIKVRLFYITFEHLSKYKILEALKKGLEFLAFSYKPVRALLDAILVTPDQG